MRLQTQVAPEIQKRLLLSRVEAESLKERDILCPTCGFRIQIDTLISIAELFHITLDYLVCGCERKAEVDDLLVGLKEKEVQFIRNMVLNAVDNMKLLTE